MGERMKRVLHDRRGERGERTTGGFAWVRGHVLTVLLMAGVGGALVGASILALRVPMSSVIRGAVIRGAVMGIAPTGDDVRRGLLRVGLDARALTAAGTRSGDVQQVVADATSYLSTNLVALAVADAGVASSRGDVERLTRLVRSGTRDRETTDALASARTMLAASVAARAGLLDGLFTAATASLGEGARPTLTTLRGQSGWTMPVEYRCAQRSEAELLRLRNALAHVRIAGDLGEDPDPAIEQFLQSLDGETEVTRARANLDAHLASVRQEMDRQLDF